MTWREGFEYWRRWASQHDNGDIIEDAARISAFYEAMILHCGGHMAQSLDDQMPDSVAQNLKMKEVS